VTNSCLRCVEAMKLVPRERDQKRERPQTLEMELEAAKASRQEEDGRLPRAKALAQELEDAKKRSSMSMHEQESQLLQLIGEIMTAQQTLKCQVSALPSERDRTAAATEQRKIGHASLLAHKASVLKAAAKCYIYMYICIYIMHTCIHTLTPRARRQFATPTSHPRAGQQH
jgi:uncharacterized coiled-coil DUF342 family protein